MLTLCRQGCLWYNIWRSWLRADTWWRWWNSSPWPIVIAIVDSFLNNSRKYKSFFVYQLSQSLLFISITTSGIMLKWEYHFLLWHCFIFIISDIVKERRTESILHSDPLPWIYLTGSQQTYWIEAYHWVDLLHHQVLKVELPSDLEVWLDPDFPETSPHLLSHSLPFS